MSEWDDIEARLEEDIYAAGNATGALAQVYAADIRSALGEIGRRGLQYPDDLGISRDAAGLSARCAELRDRLVAQGKRAEAAEADNERLRGLLARCEPVFEQMDYIAGIVERGEGKPITGDETVPQAVLRYVKGLEAEVERLKALVVSLGGQP